MAMQQFGVAGYKAALEENIALAAYLAERVAADSAFELMAPRGLSVVCFRYVDPALHGEEHVVAANRAILERLQLGGEAFITSTELAGRFVLRACIVNYRSTRADVERMLDAVKAIGAAVAVSGLGARG